MDPVFFDFECKSHQEIYFLGVRRGRHTTQYACHPALDGIVRHHRLKAKDAKAACNDLLLLSRKHRQPLACYSRHDVRVLKKLFLDREFCFLDMHKLAKRWINKFYYAEYRAHPNFMSPNGDADPWSLTSVAKFARIRWPDRYGKGKTLARISDVVSCLKEKNGRYDLVPADKKRRCFDVINHNRFDVEGLQSLFIHIKNDRSEHEFDDLLSASIFVTKKAEFLLARDI